LQLAFEIKTYHVNHKRNSVYVLNSKLKGH